MYSDLEDAFSVFSNINAETWIKSDRYTDYPIYHDEQYTYIEGRTIGDISSQVSVQGESYSQYISFIIDRYYDGVDITTKSIWIHYELADGSGSEASPINVYYNDSSVRFGWIIPDQATQQAGDIKIGVWITGTAPNEKTYLLKTETKTYAIKSGVVPGSGIIQPDQNWFEQFVSQMDNKISTAQGYANDAQDSKDASARSATAAAQSANASSQALQENKDYVEAQKAAFVGYSQRESDSKYANALTATTTGEGGVTVEDAWTAPVLGLDVVGKCEQVTTTGANLFDIVHADNIKGVASGDELYYVRVGQNSAWVESTKIPFAGESNVIYTLSAKVKCGTATNLGIAFCYSDGTFEMSNRVNDTTYGEVKVTSKADKTVNGFGFIYVSADTSGYIKDIQLQKGSTATTYEPYTGAAPSPSPDYPQDIISVGTVSTGKQMFDIKNLKAASSGTWQVADNGKKITVIGTNAYSGAVCNVPMDLVRGKTITLSGTIDRTNAKTPILQCSITSADGVTNYYICAPKTTVTLKDDDKSLQIYLYANNTLTSASSPQTAVFSDVMLNYGHTPLPWELYTGGKPSPSVEYPAELEVGVTGAQLFDASTIKTTALNGVTFINNGDGSITVKGTATAQTSTNFVTVNLEPGQYRISGGNAEIKIIARVQDGETINYYSNNKFEVTISSNINIYMQIDSGKTVNSTVWPMLNAGDQPLPWEPYKGHQTVLITLTEPLRGIGEYRDRIMCRDGVWGIERQVGEKVLAGNESVYIYTNETLIVDTVSFVIAGAAIGDGKPAKCTHSDFRILRYRGDRGEGLTSFVTVTSTVLWTKAGITPETFKAFLKEQYEAGTPVTISYLLATPTWEPLPSATQQSLNALTTYAGTTHLTITAGGLAPTVTLDYVQDTNIIIAELKKLIEELKNA